jgi:hypothetical protein
MSELLSSRLSWISLLVMLVGLFAVNEVCYRLAARRSVPSVEARRSQLDLVVASLLALLALLLAFSFDIAQDRFGKRKELLLDEANAISTTYLRADMLPAPQGERIQGLLRQYIDERANISTPDDLERALTQSTDLHIKLWREATEVARANLGSPIVALFVKSLNEVIDLHESRVTVGLFQRLPSVILGVLYFVALLSVAMVGLRSGLDRTRSLAPTVALIVVIVAVLALIDALDSPMSKVFSISKHALGDTRELIDKDHPASAMQ